MENYKPNSHRSKEQQKDPGAEKKELKKVVKGVAKVKKKGKTSKFAEMFLAEDVTSVISDVLIPAAKKLFVDVIKDSIEMLVYGNTNSGKRSSGYRADYVSYNRFADRRYDDRPANTVRRSEYSYDEVILENRGEAEEVLDVMSDVIGEYGMVSVMDLYELVGIPSKYTDNNYGWTNLRDADIVRTRDGGYLLKLPRVKPLK